MPGLPGESLVQLVTFGQVVDERYEIVEELRGDSVILPLRGLLGVEPPVRHRLRDHGEDLVTVLVGGTDPSLRGRGVIIGHGPQCSGIHTH